MIISYLFEFSDEALTRTRRDSTSDKSARRLITCIKPKLFIVTSSYKISCLTRTTTWPSSILVWATALTSGTFWTHNVARLPTQRLKVRLLDCESKWLERPVTKAFVSPLNSFCSSRLWIWSRYLVNVSYHLIQPITWKLSLLILYLLFTSGVNMYAMLAGKLPFKVENRSKNLAKLHACILKGFEMPSYLSPGKPLSLVDT